MTKYYKLIIAGSRGWTNKQELHNAVSEFLVNNNVTGRIQIVSGTARGADQMGEAYARTNNWSIKQFPADWNTYGRAAGYRRNEDMAKYADGCIVLWDGVSKGSKHMYNLAIKHGLDVMLVHPEGTSP